MLLGLIRPDEGSREAVRARPAARGRARPRRRRRLRRGAALLPVPERAPEPRAGRRPRRRRRARAHRRRARDRRPRPNAATTRSRGYSHGMKQRLGIAGALLRDPKLLLLDEPTTGLDPAGMRDMRALVHRLAEDGLTVLLSSHLMDEVEDLCDRVAIVTRGRVVYEGALDELIAGTAGPLRAAHDRRRPGRRDRPPRGRHHRRDARPRAGSRSPADERAVAALTLELAQAGIGLQRARPAHRHARGAVLPHDRRRRRSRAAHARSTEAPRMSAVALPRARSRPGVRTVYVVGAAQARRPEAHLHRPRLRAAGPADLHRLAAGRRRRPRGHPVRRLRARVRPGDPARRAVLRRVLVLPADHRARGGRHRRHRGRQRDAEDDPHPLGRPLADLRRQGARRVHLRVRRAAALRRRRAGRSAA